MNLTHILNQMKLRLNRGWFRFLFKFTALGKLLSGETAPSAWDFFNTYLNSWWISRSWFKSYFPNPEIEKEFKIIENGVDSLQEAKLFNPENLERIVSSINEVNFSAVFKYIQRAGILNQGHLNTVATHPNLVLLNEGLQHLTQARILNQENFNAIAIHENANKFAKALAFLQHAGILNINNRAAVAAHIHLAQLCEGLGYLDNARILTQDNFNAIVLDANLEKLLELNKGFYYLNKERILNQDNFDAIKSHPHPEYFAQALSYLQQARFLTPDNRNVVAVHASILQLRNGLCHLVQARILNQINFNAIVLNPNFVNLVLALASLKDAGILNQENFDALIEPQHDTLLTNEARENFWSRIPRHRLTTENFNRLLVASRDAWPMRELPRVLEQILADNPRRTPRAIFNHAQSTHTVSVHRSVSASALKLHNSYPNLDLDASIASISVYVNCLDYSLKNTAAKNCIQRITRVKYTYTDTTSKVSTLQLLALSWHGIHDESKCKGKLEDRLALFIEGLYEIQRGYNLDEEGNDNLETDAPICVAGTFNKIIEKLKSIHHDVAVNYTTHVGAMLKFPKLVGNHALKYLSQIASPETIAAYAHTRKLLDNLQERGMVVIWQEIKGAVETELWDDFQEAYEGNKRPFQEIINNGMDVELPNLDVIESQLSQSIGYQVAIKRESFDPITDAQFGFFAAPQPMEISEFKRCLGA